MAKETGVKQQVYFLSFLFIETYARGRGEAGIGEDGIKGGVRKEK